MKILDDGTVIFDDPADEADQTWESERLPWEVQACRFFTETGNIAATARRFNTTPYEIKKLMTKVWWQDEVTSLKQQIRLRTESSFSRIIEKGLAQLEDRLDNGEIIKTKIDPNTGEEVNVRVKMKARDIAAITDMAFMKRQLIRNEPTQVQGATETLTILARKLQALGGKDPTLLNGPGHTLEPTEGSVPGSAGGGNGED